MTVQRRFMLQLADRIRAKRGGLAIFNGESVGQVASQTLQSMVAINDVTTTPVIRPVATMDKTEIIKLAEDIGTLIFQFNHLKIVVLSLLHHVLRLSQSLIRLVNTKLVLMLKA